MSNPPSNTAGSFGAMLQDARTKQQLSLDAAAGELFILKRHLQALEEENFTELPQAAFARGFAINYAKYLGLDPVQVAASFDAAYPSELKSKSVNNINSPLRPMGTLQRDSHSRIRFNPMLIIAVIALIILIIFLFRMVSSASRDNTETPPVIDDISASEQAQGAAIDNQINSNIGASGSALNLGGADSTNDAALQVIVTDTSTVNITDADGSVLLSGRQSAGNYQLMGTPPFEIDIDKVENVSLQLNQETVELSQYSTGNQARFTLMP